MTWPCPFVLLFVLFLSFSLFFSLLEQQLFSQAPFSRSRSVLCSSATGSSFGNQLNSAAASAAKGEGHRHWTRNAMDCLCSSLAFLSFWAGLPLPRRREESENGETRRRRRRRTGSKRGGKEDGTRHLGTGISKKVFRTGLWTDSDNIPVYSGLSIRIAVTYFTNCTKLHKPFCITSGHFK